MQNNPPIDASANNRVAPRHRVLKAAKVVFDDWRAIDCAVRDMSDTGAKIKIDGAVGIPHKFRLLVITDNTIRDAQVAWKHENLIGVVFTGPVERAPVRKLMTGF